MIKVFNKINDRKKPEFSMPLSLRIIKECAEYGIDWKYLHIADLFSIIYSIRIDKAEEYLENKRREEMHKRGISSITKASQSDFDNL